MRQFGGQRVLTTDDARRTRQFGIRLMRLRGGGTQTGDHCTDAGGDDAGIGQTRRSLRLSTARGGGTNTHRHGTGMVGTGNTLLFFPSKTVKR